MLGSFLCQGCGRVFPSVQPVSGAAVWGLIHDLLKTRTPNSSSNQLFAPHRRNFTHKSCYFKVREVLEIITWSLNVLACFADQVLLLLRTCYTSLRGHSSHAACSKTSYSKWDLWVGCHPIAVVVCQTTILWLSGEQPYTKQKKQLQKGKVKKNERSVAKRKILFCCLCTCNQLWYQIYQEQNRMNSKKSEI